MSAVPAARVVSLQLHRARCEPLTAVDAVTGRVGGGLEGDTHVSKPRRAVLVVDRSTLDDLGLAPGDLREQVTVEGLPAVTSLEPGTLVVVGGVTLRVNGPCEPCTHIGAMVGATEVELFRAALDGRRGALCTVVGSGGVARVGDAVELVAAATGSQPSPLLDGRRAHA